MRIRCVTAWQNYRVGDVIDPPANLRDTLLAMRWNGRPFWQVIPEDSAPAPEVGAPVVAEQPNQPAEPVKRRPGRPRKYEGAAPQ